MRERLDLREEMAVLGEESRVGVNPESLLAWAESPNRLSQFWLLGVALLLPALAIAAALVWHYKGFTTPFMLVVLVEAGVAYLVRGALSDAIYGTESAFRDLKLFTGLLIRIGAHEFAAPALQELVRRLSSHTLPASATSRAWQSRRFRRCANNPILAIARRTAAVFASRRARG